MSRGADKEMISQEVGVDTMAQDDWDMQRLGKTQQLKVCSDLLRGEGVRIKTDQR
jgi:hypothetical protein